MAKKKSISLKTIADAAGVSASTVSLVLNNHGKELRIAQNTQEKVRSIAAELGYFTDNSRQSPFSEQPDPKKLYRIAVFFTAALQDFPLERFNEGLIKFCSFSEYHVDWVYHPFTPNLLSDFYHLFSREYYDGIIVTTPYERDIVFLKEHSFPIPVVLYNYQINGYTSICHDDYEIGKQAAEVFLRHKRNFIAVVTPLVCNKGISLRLAGFTNHLTSTHFPAEQLRVINGPNKNLAGGYAAVSRLLQQEFIPSAIYVINDLMTAGVVNCLREYHLRIPGDTEILSYGDMDAPFLNPSISSFSSNTEQMAYTCIENIFSELFGQTQSGLYYSFGSECIWRESCPK